MVHRLRRIASIPVLATLGACQASHGTPVGLDCGSAGGKPQLSAFLYFGRDKDGEDAPKPDGGATPIPDGEWRQFLKDEVTPRFPDGFTVFDSYGQWLNPNTGIVTRQRSAVINLVVPDSPDTIRKLHELAEYYKQKFHHISVGISLTPACASF